MNEIEPLKPKQDSFCVHYTTIGSETFSNGTKSAIKAGYSEKSAYSQACALLKNPKIQQKIKELHAENMSRNNITVDKVLADLEHDKLMAREHHQYGVAKECSIAQGKYLSMFTDNSNHNEDLILNFNFKHAADTQAKPVNATVTDTQAKTEDKGNTPKLLNP